MSQQRSCVQSRNLRKRFFEKFSIFNLSASLRKKVSGTLTKKFSEGRKNCTLRIHFNTFRNKRLLQNFFDFQFFSDFIKKLRAWDKTFPVFLSKLQSTCLRDHSAEKTLKKSRFDFFSDSGRRHFGQWSKIVQQSRENVVQRLQRNVFLVNATLLRSLRFDKSQRKRCGYWGEDNILVRNSRTVSKKNENVFFHYQIHHRWKLTKDLHLLPKSFVLVDLSLSAMVSQNQSRWSNWMSH